MLRTRCEVLSLAYVAARLVECHFIAVRIVALMALNTLRRQGGAVDQTTLIFSGRSLVAVHD